MPVNFTAVMPAPDQNKSKQIIHKSEKQLEKDFNTLLKNNKFFPSPIELITGILFFPLIPLYLIFGKTIIGWAFYSSPDCTGCSKCAAVCPVNAIKIKKKRPLWNAKCNACMRCMNICPESCIHINIPYIFILLVVSLFMFLSNDLYNGISRFLYDNVKFLDSWFFIYLFYFVFLYFLAWIFHKISEALLRIKLINWLYTFFSYTRFFKKYINPKIKKTDLTKKH